MENNKYKNKCRIYSNYKRNNKWLGIIDYKSLIVIITYVFIIIAILKMIPLKFEYLVYIFIILVIPVISLIAINMSDESAVDSLIQVLKYCINNKDEFIL